MDAREKEALLLANQLCFPLYAAARGVTGLYAPWLKPLGLSYTQYLVCLVLWEQDGITVGEIGRRLRLDNGTLSPLLKKMEQAGLLERRRSPEDDRAVLVSLSPQGRLLQERAKDIPSNVGSCLPLEPEEARQLYQLLYKLLAKLPVGAASPGKGENMSRIYDFTAKDRKGEEVSLSQYQGKVLLIVNTATGCGFTPHYEPLAAMYKDLKDQGLEILDFPCNQFANQAPGSDEEIHQFCQVKFGTQFPQFAKVDVNGEQAHPLFAYLAGEKPFAGFGKGIKSSGLEAFAALNNKAYGDKAYVRWNFTKFLVDRQGQVIGRFEPTEDMNKVRAAVEAALKA